MPGNHIVDTLALALHKQHKATRPILPTTLGEEVLLNFALFLLSTCECLWPAGGFLAHQQRAAPLTTSHYVSHAFSIWHAAKRFSPMDCARAWQTSDVLACQQQGVAHHGACPCPPEWMCLACVTLCHNKCAQQCCWRVWHMMLHHLSALC